MSDLERETYDEMLARRTRELGVSVSEIEHTNAVFYRDLKMCGCGNPMAAQKLVHDLLRLHATQRLTVGSEVADLIGTAGAIHLVLGVLEAADLTDHGSSYWGGWLTDKGKWLLDVLNRIDGVDVADLCADLCLGLPHDGGECVEACWSRPPDIQHNDIYAVPTE